MGWTGNRRDGAGQGRSRSRGHRRGHRRGRILVGLVLVAMLGAAACTERASTRTLPPVRSGAGEIALAAFDDCDALLDAARTEAAELVAGREAGTGRGAEDLTAAVPSAADPSSVDGATSGAEAASAPPTTVGPGPSPSTPPGDTPTPPGDSSTPGRWGGTNVQEGEVDEPDIVKTDGDRLLVRSATGLASVLSGPDGLTLAGALELPSGPDAQLLVDGGRALVISGGGGPWLPTDGITAESMPMPTAGTSLTVVDIRDPASLVVESQTTLDATLVSARLVDGMVRVVTTTSALPVALTTGDVPVADAIETSTAADWLPRFRTVGADGRETDAGPLVPCDAVFAPADVGADEPSTTTTVPDPDQGDLDEPMSDGPASDGPAAFSVAPATPPVTASTVTVTGLDLRAPSPRPDGGAAIMGAGEIVYASPSSLYVTSVDPVVDPGTGGVATAVHRFAIGGRGPAVYTGSGSVPGTVLDQFSLSEGPGGELRVATTQWATGPDRPSESFVTVLAAGEAGLDRIGQVGGLGLTEQIRSVRFLGEVGYVVTFRQTDPLYVIDLRDPAAPAVTGELKIPGYSGYLHPLGEGRILGVGQDATDDGRLLGLQVSIFDVSDPAAPTRTAELTVPDATALAESDHHAFLWAPEHGLLVLPAQGWSADGGYLGGALALGVEGTELVDRGWLTHPVEDPYGYGPYGYGIERALVVDERLLTVSLGGIETTDLASLADLGWLALG